MIALDTNVLLRFTLRDEPEQAKAAFRLLEAIAAEGEAAFVSSVTLVEFVWVLEDAYEVDTAEVLRIVRKLLDAEHIVIEQEDAVRRSLESDHGDFADRLIHFAGVAAGCERTVTFDRKFARLPGVELLKA